MYVTEYTGYSEDPELQEGHFLALKATSTDGATVTAEVVGGDEDPVTLDTDMNCVLRVTNNDQKIKFVSEKDGIKVTKIFDLSILELEPQE